MKVSTWICFHLYYKVDYFAFIKLALLPIYQFVLGNNGIESMFFVRYSDDLGAHVRVRVRVNIDNRTLVYKEMLSFLNSNFCLVSEEEFMSSIDSFEGLKILVFEPDYAPEIDRYGGEVGVVLCEKQFEISSNSILEMFSTNLSWTYSDSVTSAFQLHLIFVRLLGMSISDCSSFFYLIFQLWSTNAIKSIESSSTTLSMDDLVGVFENSYNANKAGVSNLVGYFYLDGLFSDAIDSFPFLLNTITDMRTFVSDLVDANKNGLLKKSGTSDLYGSITFSNVLFKEQLSMLTSLVHMTNNRLGISNSEESYIGYCLYRFFSTM